MLVSSLSLAMVQWSTLCTSAWPQLPLRNHFLPVTPCDLWWDCPPFSLYVVFPPSYCSAGSLPYSSLGTCGKFWISPVQKTGAREQNTISLSLMLCHHFYSHCGYFLLAENNLPPISIWSSKIRNETRRTSLVVQWLTWIWSLVWEDPTCCWAAKCLCCNYWKSVAKIKMLQDSMKIPCVMTKTRCSQLNK